MASAPVRWESLSEGAEVPQLVKTPSAMQLFMFSAVTWNRHLIHYNAEFARSDGLKNLAVHRALIGGFLGQMLSEWLGDRGELLQLEWSVRGSAALDKPLTCRGTLAGKRIEGDDRLLDVDVWAENHDGELIVPGKAVMRLLGD